MLELIMQTDLERSLPAQIDFNFEALKEALIEQTEKYNNLVVTEDAIAPAKKDRAALNRLVNALEDKRKEVKKQCLAPYEDFERKIKELVSLVNKPIMAIDSQIKAFEQAKIDEKRAAIEQFYRANAGNLVDLLPLDRIVNPKWANATMPLMQVTQELYDKLTKVRNDLKLIATIGGEYATQMQDAYLRTLDMSVALAEKKRLEEQAEALKKVAPIESKPAPQETQENAPVSEFPPDTTQEETKTIKVVFYDTTAAFRAEMRALTEKHNIKYGGIK